MQTNIIVNLDVEAFHCWPAAKDVFPEVAFLSDRHRHIFKICCKKKVTHSDRDVEIIMFKREVLNYLYEKYSKTVLPICEFEHRSCEMLAEELLKQFDLEYCAVLEDGENGAEVCK